MFDDDHTGIAVCELLNANYETSDNTKIPISIFGDHMLTAVRSVSLVVLLLALSHPTFAQTPLDSRLVVAHPGFNLLKSDLMKTIDLTTPGEQKQWENIQGYIDTFIIGIDETREVQIQIMTGIDPPGYLICVPLLAGSDPAKAFKENLDSLGYRLVRSPTDRKMYTIESDANEYGWMKIDVELQYAFFMITTDKALLVQIKETVLKAALTPTTLNENLIAEIKNIDVSPAAITHRVNMFKPIREKNLALIKQRPDEKATGFQLRKSSARQLYDEAERLMSQADQLLMTLTLDRTNPVAPKVNLRTIMTAIPGTAIEATIAEYGQQPDAFASLQRLNGSALSLRVSHPLDALRKAHLQETLALSKVDIQGRLTANKTRSDAEKTAFNKFVAGVVSVLESSVTFGHLNGFVESVPDGKDRFTTVAAFVSPTAAEMNQILPLLTDAGKGNAVQLNLEKVGDVDIHKIQIAEGFISIFDKVFGGHSDMFIGVGPRTVWMAAGQDGLATLKSTVMAVGEPTVNPVAFRVDGNLLPWAKRIDAVANDNKPRDLTAEEQKLRREQARIRERALAALVTEDDFSLVITTEESTWVGEFTSNTGLLRFVGKMMSAFSKENFE